VDGFDLQVIATTDAGTRGALAEARRLSPGSTGRVVLIVPRLTSSAMHAGPVDDRRVSAEYRHLAAASGVDAVVRLCVGRSAADVVRWMVSKGTVTVVGGRRRWWWPTRAQRIVRDLERRGHRVVFADVG
jgi:hypothetical protein